MKWTISQIKSFSDKIIKNIIISHCLLATLCVYSVVKLKTVQTPVYRHSLCFGWYNYGATYFLKAMNQISHLTLGWS